MSDPTVMLIVVVVLALAFDFSNGWHDSANAIATVVSTHVLNPAQAVLLAAVLNIAGAFMSTAVAKMIGGGIVEASLINQETVAAALVGAIVWNTLTLLLGLPTSSSHALIGGLVGGTLAQNAGAVAVVIYQSAGIDSIGGVLTGASNTGIPALLIGNTDGAAVKAGGVVYLSAAAATRDEFYEPYIPSFASNIWPADAATRLKKESHEYNERKDLPSIKPMTTASPSWARSAPHPPWSTPGF